MNIDNIEGNIDNGQFRVLDNTVPLESEYDFEIVPELPTSGMFRIYTPRILNSKQASDFVKELIEEPGDE